MNTLRLRAVTAALVPAVALAQSSSAWRDASAALAWQNPPATSSADDMLS